MLARARLRAGRRYTLLDSTSLVHEFYLRFAGAEGLPIQDRDHFIRYASRAMRCVIVDFVRKRQAAQRRGARHTQQPGFGRHGYRGKRDPAVHEALDELAALDAQMAQVVGDARALRRQFGVVLQEPALFSGSVRQNIAFQNRGLPLEQVMEAARIAEIHDDLERLPMRYETVLIEGGAGLSGGQRQRIAIARALVRRPPILLLDEATSHPDTLTESRLEKNLGRLGCTRIVIAHRMSTIFDADWIVVLEEGAIVEQGRHEELLARDGHYAAMVGGQGATARAGGATLGLAVSSTKRSQSRLNEHDLRHHVP